MAPLQEVVESHEQGIGGKLPLVLSEAFVLEVGIFELCADVDGGLELLRGVNWLFLKELEDLST